MYYLTLCSAARYIFSSRNNKQQFITLRKCKKYKAFMSYQVIARKWRPQTFEEVTGQEIITRTLRNGIEHDRLHHAYLFSGARGVGKTTTARLLAKALNCHKTATPNPRPCSPGDAEPMCASCQEIAEGRSIDVLEIDAASNTGVDNVREVIINNLGISPARDRFKVFIIDEVHMLSTSSFNALLKSVEEPPPQVVFIMATTELHKVPDTILSRCQEFEFRTISTAKIYERLKLIAEAENVNIAPEALREIARAGEGSMRDAQSSFDQVISFSGEKIETQDVINALGIASSEMLTRTVDAIADQDAKAALLVVEELTRRGQDFRNFCRDLLSHFRDLLVTKIAGDAEELVDSAALHHAELAAQTKNFTEADLIRFFNSLSETELQLRNATQPRYVLEIGLIKLIEMRRVTPLEKILERLAHLENALSNGNLPTPNSQSSKTDAALKPIDLTNVIEPISEKKTLSVDFPLSEVPFPVSSPKNVPAAVISGKSSLAAQPAFIGAPAAAPVEPEPIKELSLKPDTDFQSFPIVETPAFAPDFLDSVPLKLPPITSEDLEHVEDNWLDTAFEDRLIREGDPLNVISGASRLAEKILGANGFTGNFASASEFSNGATAAAPAKIRDKPVFVPPIFEPEKISDEIPVLPENPTAEDLRRYAENHPKVKLAMRIFRAKIVGVSQNGQVEKT
jgi:DNA polymerase III subunit gamma/tau